MSKKLVLYTEGNKKDIQEMYGDGWDFVNCKYSSLKDNTQGCRYTEVRFNDTGITLEDQEYSYKLIISESAWGRLYGE